MILARISKPNRTLQSPLANHCCDGKSHHHHPRQYHLLGPSPSLPIPAPAMASPSCYSSTPPSTPTSQPSSTPSSLAADATSRRGSAARPSSSSLDHGTTPPHLCLPRHRMVGPLCLHALHHGLRPALHRSSTRGGGANHGSQLDHDPCAARLHQEAQPGTLVDGCRITAFKILLQEES